MTKKIYFDNPYLKNLKSNIIETKVKDGFYHIILDRTIFYPHLCGGQIRDKGNIDNIKVIDVYEKDEDIVHVIDKKIKSKNVRLSIDWDHRFDMMQQHTGQHILSLAIHKLFGAETVSFHISKDYASIDVDMQDLQRAQINQIEMLANKIIQSNFKIKAYFKEDKTTRIVEIEDMDHNPCGGTHVYATGEVGLLKIIKSSNYKSKTHIEFLCGMRAIRDYNLKDEITGEMSKLLSSQIKNILQKAKKIIDSKNSLEKENKDLRKELYKLKAESYINDIKTVEGVNYIVKDLKDTDLKEISLISSNIDTKNTIQIYNIKNSDMGYFYLSKSNDIDLNLKEVLQEVSENIIVKGGGNPRCIQGKSSIHLLDRVIQMLYNKIREKIKA